MEDHVLIPHTTAKGGLFSVLDNTPQYAPGTRYIEINADGDYRVYLYAYSNALKVKNTIYERSWGAAGTNPMFIAITDAASITLKGIAQAAIPSGYWGWFHVEGPTEIAAITGSLNATAGQGLSIEAGGVPALTTLGLTDLKDFATVLDTANASTHPIWLFGYETLNTAT